MGNVLPAWAQWGQAFLSLTMPIAVAIIAYFQWCTAQRKMMMDLFDRRMAIYTRCQSVLRAVVGNPDKVSATNAHDFLEAKFDAEFLFGSEVIREFKAIEGALFDLATCVAELTDSDRERSDNLKKRRTAIDKIRVFYHHTFRALMHPYLRLDQKF